MFKEFRSGKVHFGLILLIVVLLLTAIMVGAAFAILPQSSRIAQGVVVDGIILSGMDEQQANQALSSHISSVTDKTIKLIAGDDAQDVQLRELGARPDAAAAVQTAFAIGRKGSIIVRLSTAGKAKWNGVILPLAYSVDEPAIDKILDKFSKSINQQPVDASAHWDGAKVVSIPGRVGAILDVPASAKIVKETVLNSLSANKPLPDKIELVYEKKLPKITTEMLSHIDTLLGEFSTTYGNSSRNRINNIRLASNTISGRLLHPGEVFAFNKEVGRRTVAKGYRSAPVIINGEMDTGIGGGICQVSTTLYNAVLLANLEIVSRSHHSLPSHYVKSGMDATVSYPYPEFSFRNSSDAPVMIETQPKGRLVIRIIGKGPKPVVRIERSGISSFAPKSKIIKDPTLPKDVKVIEEKGKAGIAVTVTRVVGSGPSATRQVMSRDRYLGSPAVIRLGTGPEKPAPPETETTPPEPEENPPAAE